MTDDDFRRLMETTTSEMRRHFDLSSESLRGELRAVAEAVQGVDEKVEREANSVRDEMRRGFADT